MTAQVISFTAARTARMLRDNAPPSWIDSFLVQMTSVAREQRDIAREAFWREVASLLDRERTLIAV
ncbi:MAG TPA: hypothetical protein VN668_12090 [Stellaceae bacterium]|nr:hypothetical protein [Stellaceae bacterium]